jgi:NadR type nicotinamide-nucleotide adenylyltransferase
MVQGTDIWSARVIFAIMVKKVVVLGPESTGKSTLCRMLADHYTTLWCPEYAREYLNLHGTAYQFEDLIKIARGQLELESHFLQKVIQQAGTTVPNGSPFLFVDTDQYVMKVWSEFVFDDCHTWILKQIAASTGSLYLLCKPDLPWVSDTMREYPDEKPRQELYHIYRDLLIHQTVPWVEISGDYEERFQMAKRAVDAL